MQEYRPWWGDDNSLLKSTMLKLSVQQRQFFRRLKPPQTLWRLCGFLGIQAVNAWMSTLSYRMYRYDPAADPSHANFQGPAIFIFWHEYIPFPLYVRPNCRLSMLVSQHQDAEILSHLARFAGFSVVRGSSSRGGTTALRELIAHGKGMNLAITPDGPRGPRRHLAQGCVYLSSRLQIPIIPLGVGYNRPWRNRSSWDHFAIPRPFSRCRGVLGPQIQIPPDLQRNEIEECRTWVESQLKQLSTLAEDWAEARCDLAGSEILFRRPQHSVRHAKATTTAQTVAATTPSFPIRVAS
jgi:lysophospholipid acyltransferase (LPLAT)-like uncharacterized protein